MKYIDLPDPVSVKSSFNDHLGGLNKTKPKKEVMIKIKEKFDEILPEIRWKIKGNGFYKNQLMVLGHLNYLE